MKGVADDGHGYDGANACVVLIDDVLACGGFAALVVGVLLGWGGFVELMVVLVRGGFAMLMKPADAAF